MATKQLDVERAVKQRYSAGARQRQSALCCPVSYNGDLLKLIPAEIIERDYGCGDPSRHVREGETVLDLGSGGGKVCYIAAQIVGPTGRVIGVDFNDDMLALARKYQREMARRLGYANVEFHKGMIQDLTLDLDALDAQLRHRPARTATDYLKLKAHAPLIADDSVDVVVSNCVLNLVRHEDKSQLFREIYRVLKRGGRAVISDIVSDEPVPVTLQRNARLWSGCVSGALTEEGFLQAFEAAGFYGIQLLERDAEPWRVVKGIEFRSVTVAAYKGKDGPCWERNQAIIYKGPFKEVVDDDGHRLKRGVRTAVCDKTFQIYSRAPYRDHVAHVAPRKPVPLAKAKPFDCARQTPRHPRETKGQHANGTTGNGCGPGCC